MMTVLHLNGTVVILAESYGRNRITVLYGGNEFGDLLWTAQSPLCHKERGKMHRRRRKPGLRVSVAAERR